MAQAPLTDKQIRLIHTPGRHWAAPNLFVICTDDGAKSWYARVRLQSGKRSWRVLGSCDAIPIRDAQKKAILLSGERVDDSSRGRTFGTAFEEYVEMNRSSWKGESSERQWRQTFTDYIDRHIGALPVGDIKPFHVAAILKPIWNSKAETARRIRGRIETVIDFEQARLGALEINPAQLRFIKNLLPKQKDVGGQHEAPTLTELKAMYQSLGKSASHLALKWTIEHACRTTETREATWSEIKGDVWAIPAERMKGGKAHKSPIVGQLPKRGKGLLFPNIEGYALSLNGMRAILQKRGITWTVHGIRSCFRTWCQECGVPDRVAEQQLAHVDKDKIQRAYARSDLLEERRKLMQKWYEVLNEKG